MLFDLLHELSCIRVELPIRFGEVTKLVSDEWLDETTGATHVRCAEHTDLKVGLVMNVGRAAANNPHLFPVGADGENFDTLPSLSPLSLSEVYE